MAKVVLASQLARWIPSAADGEATVPDIAGATVGEVLDGLFARHPGLRGYVVDEQGVIRHHVAVFVDGSALPRKDRLDHPLDPQSELHVLQALSGG